MNAPSSIATLRRTLNADRRMLRAAVERGALIRVRALIQEAPAVDEPAALTALGPLDGYQWIAIIGGHEMRHSLQVDEIAAGLMGHA